MEEIMVLAAKALLGFGLAYWVYKDSHKKKIKYSNLWLIGTFVFPPIALAYYIYQATAGSNTELTLKQKFEIELRQQTEQNKKAVEKERKEMEPRLENSTNY